MPKISSIVVEFLYSYSFRSLAWSLAASLRGEARPVARLLFDLSRRKYGTRARVNDFALRLARGIAKLQYDCQVAESVCCAFVGSDHAGLRGCLVAGRRESFRGGLAWGQHRWESIPAVGAINNVHKSNRYVVVHNAAVADATDIRTGSEAIFL